MFIIRPRAIPAAGACSVFVIAMINIAIPTVIAPKITSDELRPVIDIWMLFHVEIKWKIIPIEIPTV